MPERPEVCCTPMDVISSPINGFWIFLAGCKATTPLSCEMAVALNGFSSLRGAFSTSSSCVHMSFSLPRVCRQRRKLGRHLCTSGRPDGLCGVGVRLRRPRGGLGCIGAGEWTYVGVVDRRLTLQVVISQNGGNHWKVPNVFFFWVAVMGGLGGGQ